MNLPFMEEIEKKIRDEAKKGAEEAIPRIRQEVKDTAQKEIEPIIKGHIKTAYALGGIAIIISFLALIRR